MLDMGQRIRIDDLACRLIRLRGLRPVVVQGSAGAGERGSRGAGEQGSRGAWGQRSKGAEERLSTSAPLHPSTSAPQHPSTLAPLHPSTSAPPHPGTGDIPIVYTGVRPGEKMHEELLGDGEEREPTAHPHIFRVRNGSTFNACPEQSRRVERSTLNELVALAEAQRNRELVERLQELVGQ